jgi:hypothetical protein
MALDAISVIAEADQVACARASTYVAKPGLRT